jgi:hypothetical protein
MNEFSIVGLPAASGVRVAMRTVPLEANPHAAMFD